MTAGEFLLQRQLFRNKDIKLLNYRANQAVSPFILSKIRLFIDHAK